MGKNFKGGKGKKRGKNKNPIIENKQLTLKDVQQDYAKVTKMLGNCRLNAINTDKQELLCIIRGNMRKKVYIKVGDIILISYRDFQVGKADIIAKYSNDDVMKLKKLGHLDTITDNSIFSSTDDTDIAFDFDTI